MFSTKHTIYCLCGVIAILAGLPTVDAQTQYRGAFLAVGYGGRRAISYDGRTWTNVARWAEDGSDDDNALRGCTWGNGIFIAVGGSKIGRIAASRFGQRWHEQTIEDGWIGDVAYGNRTYVAVGSGGLTLRSTDGVNWTHKSRTKEQTGAWPRHYRQIVFGNGRFVAIGDQGRRTISTDGITWTHDAPINEELNRTHIAFGSGRFVIVGKSGYLVTSPDGINWSVPQANWPGEDFKSIAHDGKKFIAASRTRALVSDDAKHWTLIEGKHFPDRTFSGGGVYIGTTWQSKMAFSPNGLDWTHATDSKLNAITDFSYGAVPR